MDEKTYLQGIPLNKAIFEMADAELLRRYNETLQIKNNPPKAPDGMLELLNFAANELQRMQNNQNKRNELEKAFKSGLLQLIKNGELKAFGFKLPRNIQDQPIKIPTDLFFGGEINWNKSELKCQSLEFSGIRIFKDLTTIIDLIPNNSINAPKQIQNNSEKAKKSHFADLDPELHIDEKKAAEFLGVSPRTLQGYRLKGGGPEYLKLKKAVRYKIQDLIKWAGDNKKENTSQ